MLRLLSYGICNIRYGHMSLNVSSRFLKTSIPGFKRKEITPYLFVI